MPCRRATKDAVKLCKGPDNEFKNVRRPQHAESLSQSPEGLAPARCAPSSRALAMPPRRPAWLLPQNIYNGFVEGVVDLFCGLKFPAWLAILTTFGVIIGFFIIIGVIVSDSINGLLNDRDKWVSQWEKLNNQVAELAAQQGFTVTSEDINKGATEFLLNNVVTPLTSLLPSIITYTFLTLAFLVFVLVSPSTFFGDSDALTTTDPDELSCSDDEVPDDELAAAVDNVITAQAAAILVEEEDDEDDGILGESRKSRNSHRASLRRPVSAAHWGRSHAIAGSARQLLAHDMQRRRTTAHFGTPQGGSARGQGRRHHGLAATTHFAGRHGIMQPPVSPGTVGQWRVDVQTGWKPRPRTAEPSPVADGKRAPGQRMRREELSQEEGAGGAGEGASEREHRPADREGGQHRPSRPHSSPSASTSGRLDLPRGRAQGPRPTLETIGSGNDDSEGERLAHPMAVSPHRMRVAGPRTDARVPAQRAYRGESAPSGDRARATEDSGEEAAEGWASRRHEAGEPTAEAAAAAAGAAAAAAAAAAKRRGAAWAPPGGTLPPLAAGELAALSSASGRDESSKRPGGQRQEQEQRMRALSEGVATAGQRQQGGPPASGGPGHRADPAVVIDPIEELSAPVGHHPSSRRSSAEPRPSGQHDSATASRESSLPGRRLASRTDAAARSRAATEGQAVSSGGRSSTAAAGAEPDSKARPRAGSNLMHRATKVLEVVGLNIAEGSSTENEEDTEDEIPLEADQEKHGATFAMSPYPAAHVGSPGGPEMDADMLALEENRRRLRAWARRQRRAGRYLDNAEATAVMLHQKAQRRVTRYIVVHSWLSAATGVSVGLSLLAIGAPLPALFGLMAFVLNFIPSVGSWIATILPIPFILFDPDSDFTTLILAIMLPGFMQVLLGNFVEPALLGKLCKVDPIVILVSILLFGYVWGIAGMVLAVPMVVIIKLVFKQMAHPIPRYIAGIIVGNLYRYRARLDRDVRRRIRYQRLLRAAESARESAEHAALSPALEEAAEKGLAAEQEHESSASLQMRGEEDHSDSCGPGGAVLGPRLRHSRGEESRRVRWTQGRLSAREWAAGAGAGASLPRVSRSARGSRDPMANTAPAQPRRRSHEPVGQEMV